MTETLETVSVVIRSAGGVAQITSSSGVFETNDMIGTSIGLVGLFLSGVCICRMNALSPRKHKLRVRLHYLFVFVGSLCLAGSPWFWPQYPRLGELIFLSAVLASVMLSTTEWIHGAPRSLDRSFEPLQMELDHGENSPTMAERFNSLWRSVKHFAALVDDLFRGNR